ncbi:glycosyltransferase [Flavobacterium sp. PL002]|uniref:glycosyltransferase n=1 Tax=Flavobacterium sp. PL002 TaxID=1897058 RepID=UPI0017884B53|nr:glycosyltransferase [Flavobacterium sp. PL002]MBE0391125.1 N,N'-diacetylbacillosaminyl-diphospho-undecaprenol alpha-1,3-N-acetylgalactosaminyltransferase [Flavobacterium sp. PL002]
MRIVQIIDSLEAGGAERMAVNYANALAQEISFSGIVVTRKEGPLLNAINSNCSYLFLDKKQTIDFQAFFKLRKYIITHNVAIVHAHGTSFFIAVLLKISYPKIKVIWHEHYGARVNQTASANAVLILCSLFFNAIFVVNKQLLTWVKQKTFCQKAYYIPNFTAFDTQKKGTTILQGNDGQRIVCVANLKHPKNHLALLRAFKVLNEAQWTLHFIGEDYDDDYSKAIRDYIQLENLEGFVFLHGAKSDVKNILSQATIGVLASTAEGFPVSLLEYGLAGLATLSTNVGSCSEIVTDRVSGLLFDPNNEKELKNQLYKIISDKPLRDRFGLYLQESVLQQYSKKIVLKQLIATYDEIKND